MSRVLCVCDIVHGNIAFITNGTQRGKETGFLL